MSMPVRETMRKVYDALNRGEVEEIREAFSPTAKWNQPGRNPFSGTYVGVDKVLDVVKRVHAASEGRFIWDLVDTLVGDEYCAAIVDTRNTRTDETLREVHVFRLGQDGLVEEAWSYSADQASSDKGLFAGVISLVEDAPSF